MPWNILDTIFPPSMRPDNPAYVGNKGPKMGPPAPARGNGNNNPYGATGGIGSADPYGAAPRRTGGRGGMPKAKAAPGGQGASSAGEFYSRGAAPKPAAPRTGGLPASAAQLPPGTWPAGVPGVGSTPGAARQRANQRVTTSAEDRQLRQAMGIRGGMPAGSAGTPMAVNPVRENFWKAEENAAALEAAQQAGEAANKARLDQKLGYLSSGAGLPATSDPSQDAYWARADMAMWANANQELAKKKGWDPSRDYSAGGQAPTGFSYDITQSEGVGAEIARMQQSPAASYGALSADEAANAVAMGFDPGTSFGVDRGNGGLETFDPANNGMISEDRAAAAVAAGFNRPPAQTSLAPGEANVAVFDPAGGEAPDPRKEQANLLNRQVIDKLKASAGYTPREYQYGGPVEQEDELRAQYPWTLR